MYEVKCRVTGHVYACKTMAKKNNPLWLQEAQLLNKCDHPGETRERRKVVPAAVCRLLCAVSRVLCAVCCMPCTIANTNVASFYFFLLLPPLPGVNKLVAVYDPEGEGMKGAGGKAGSRGGAGRSRKVGSGYVLQCLFLAMSRSYVSRSVFFSQCLFFSVSISLIVYVSRSVYFSSFI